jgi:hypothetical protein
MEMAAFCKDEMTIPCSYFKWHYNASGLLFLNSDHKPLEVVRTAAAAYAQGLVISKKKWTSKAAALNWCLTEQEELSLVQFICLMASMGHGVTKPNVISLIDEYVNLEEDERKALEVSEKVLCGLFGTRTKLNW